MSFFEYLAGWHRTEKNAIREQNGWFEREPHTRPRMPILRIFDWELALEAALGFLAAVLLLAYVVYRAW